MGLQDFLPWRTRPAIASSPVADDEELIAEDVDEPPEPPPQQQQQQQQHPRVSSEFHRSTVRPQSRTMTSLLTKAFLQRREDEAQTVAVTSNIYRPRSLHSNCSLASTAELTSDEGFTSPSRTNTPSPPIPTNTSVGFIVPYDLTPKPTNTAVGEDNHDDDAHHHNQITVLSEIDVPLAAPVPKKRCITFLCDGLKESTSKANNSSSRTQVRELRKSTIKFTCAATQQLPLLQQPPQLTKRCPSRSPSVCRKTSRPALYARSQRDSNSTVRRMSQSPLAVRARPKSMVADENDKFLHLSGAIQFHEFASDEIQLDDWIRQDTGLTKAKLTINDTLRRENEIRRLGDEAEEEAMAEEDEEDEDEDDGGHESDDDDDGNDFDDDDDDDDDDPNHSDRPGRFSDPGNEPDSESGFADSDDSDAEEATFWTPSRRILGTEASTYFTSAHWAASTSSVDSVTRRDRPTRRRTRCRPIKIRPCTPDLPDSTDFVCGTLDEDRPLEDAFMSCMEARKKAKHRLTPQDIDPSFPTSDMDDDEDDDDNDDNHDDDDGDDREIIDQANVFEESEWLHGTFEETDEEPLGRGRSTNICRITRPGLSPLRCHSPIRARRLHSPPPPKPRLRILPPPAPPRQNLGNFPRRRLRSPPPVARAGHYLLKGTPSGPNTTIAIPCARLAYRPGLTHTKSLPRSPNPFCRQYRASRFDSASGNGHHDGEHHDAHIRGAIDIVKGLEHRRQRRKEKLYSKQNARKGKGHIERRPPPGKGAERMRELGLLMAGKMGPHNPYILSA